MMWPKTTSLLMNVFVSRSRAKQLKRFSPQALEMRPKGAHQMQPKGAHQMRLKAAHQILAPKRQPTSADGVSAANDRKYETLTNETHGSAVRRHLLELNPGN